MTEKQGGSDVRANTTRAVPDPAAGDGGYLLTGHKWFCSAPMCDLFLVLAQAPEGLTCFLLPRVLPDGSRNAMRIQRLKDKLGNRSNASAEVEYDGALAWLVGEPGRGIATIIEMVSATRLDCVLGSAAQMRQACVTAADYATQRQAFGVGAHRPPADGQRHRRPDPGVGGGHHAGASGWPGRPTGRPAATPPRPSSCGWRCRPPSTGCASAPRWSPARPWNAWAATATSRTPACPGCTGTRR